MTGSASYKIFSALNHKRLLPSALYITCSCISGRAFLTGTDTLQLLLEQSLLKKVSIFRNHTPFITHFLINMTQQMRIHNHFIQLNQYSFG